MNRQRRGHRRHLRCADCTRTIYIPYCDTKHFCPHCGGELLHPRSIRGVLLLILCVALVGLLAVGVWLVHTNAGP